MKFQLFKLISGEEVIGEVLTETNQFSSVRNPLLISFEKDHRSGVVGVILVNYIPFSKLDTVDIPSSSIMLKTDISKSMIEYYEKSIEYDSLYHNKKLKQSIEYAINQLDRLIDEQTIDKNSKKQYSKEIIEKMILINSTPNSNTMN
jgi:hypothetical protein